MSKSDTCRQQEGARPVTLNLLACRDMNATYVACLHFMCSLKQHILGWTSHPSGSSIIQLQSILISAKRYLLRQPFTFMLAAAVYCSKRPASVASITYIWCRRACRICCAAAPTRYLDVAAVARFLAMRCCLRSSAVLGLRLPPGEVGADSRPAMPV